MITSERETSLRTFASKLRKVESSGERESVQRLYAAFNGMPREEQEFIAGCSNPSKYANPSKVHPHYRGYR